MEGFTPKIDPATKQPAFFAAKTATAEENPDDVYWDNRMSSSIPGFNGEISALAVYNGKLIAGGDFTLVGGIPVNHITAWNGASWSALGAGMDNTVSSLTVYNGTLIAGGYFTAAGGIPANHVAAWDGSDWSPLGEGRGNDMTRITALTVYDGKLITGGGWFGGEVSAWDGASWSTLGSGVGGPYADVYALMVYDGKLIAGGRFAHAIAVWDGSSWSPLGGGMTAGSDGYGGDTSFILSLSVYKGNLIAGGRFFTAGGKSASCIASWNGSSWSPLGLGVNHPVYSLLVYDTKLIAGGSFAYADNSLAIHIAAWDGSSWSPLGSGAGGDENEYNEVLSLAYYDDKLIAGGSFQTAGGKIAPYIAAWTKKDPTVVSEPPALPASLRLSPAFPNPFNPSTTIDFTIPVESRVTVKVHNLAGQEVATLKDERMPAGKHMVTWDAAGMPSGVYFCTVKAGKFSETRKMTLLK
jgi:hypothetical protein